MFFEKESVFLHHWIWANEHIRIVDLGDGEVLQEVSIALLNASVRDPGLLLNLLSGAEFIETSLSLVCAWMMNFYNP